MNATLWLWIGAAGMLAGTTVPAWFGLRDADNRRYYAILAGVTGIASVAYLVMALGYGSVTVDGRAVLLVRYADWLLTTPLMVLFLGALARPPRRVYLALVVSDVVVMGSGAVADVLPGAAAWAAFGIGSVAYLVLAYMLVRALPRRYSFASECGFAFTKLRNLTVVLWSIYPIVWLLSTSGLGLLDVGTEVLVIAYLDLISKVGFVLIAVRHRRALDELRSVRFTGEGAAGAD